MDVMKSLGVAAIGILLLVVIFSVVPMVGQNVDDVTSIPVGSQWNSTTNTDIETGSDLWGSTSGMISLAAIIAIVGYVLNSITNFNKKD